MPGFLVAGNWKMNGLSGSISEVVRIAEAYPQPACEIVICPPAALLSRMAARLAGSSVRLGGQDCHPAVSGAHTGDHSAEMLADAGAEFAILGHSERRHGYDESNELIRSKVRAAWRAGLTAIVCVGETESQRNTGQELDAVGAQIRESIPGSASTSDLIIAYEPVWAIGTGRTADIGDIAAMHSFVRQICIKKFADGEGGSIRLLYGGSVTPPNAESIFSVPDVNGALVGGASLTASSFTQIIKAVPTV